MGEGRGAEGRQGGTGAKQAVEAPGGERDARPRRLHRLLPRHELAVAAGAVLGASARYAVGGLIGPTPPPGLPIATLAVNLLGCLLIGAAQTLFLDLLRVRRELQLFVSVGFLGGLTTFSAVSVELLRLAQAGALPTAAAYLLLSLAGGLAAVLLGAQLAHAGHRLLAGRGAHL